MASLRSGHSHFCSSAGSSTKIRRVCCLSLPRAYSRVRRFRPKREVIFLPPRFIHCHFLLSADVWLFLSFQLSIPAQKFVNNWLRDVLLGCKTSSLEEGGGGNRFPVDWSGHSLPGTPTCEACSLRVSETVGPHLTKRAFVDLILRSKLWESITTYLLFYQSSGCSSGYFDSRHQTAGSDVMYVNSFLICLSTEIYATMSERLQRVLVGRINWLKIQEG